MKTSHSKQLIANRGLAKFICFQLGTMLLGSIFNVWWVIMSRTESKQEDARRDPETYRVAGDKRVARGLLYG